MKMVKSLLLGSATALVAVSGAAAADLPVKAKPVQYVKICSLYGQGYFYIPGSDTCIKLGGAVRVQADLNGTAGVPVGFNNTLGTFDRTAYAPITQRTRIYFSFDTRQQTEYGTLRTYARFGIQQTTPVDGAGGAVFWDRAFTQFAGLTIGKTVSYYDAFGTGDLMYNTTRLMGDSSPTGVTVLAYTAQFGNGISATIAAEDPNARARLIAPAGGGAPGGDVGFTAGATGFRYPDLVGNIRIDQAWGSAQLSGAIRDVAQDDTGPAPGSKVGFAIGAGLNINLPGWGAVGIANSQPNVDQFRVGASYCEGMNGYCTTTNGLYRIQRGIMVTGANAPDAVTVLGPGAAQDISMTNTWSVFAAYQHIWTPTLRTSLYGGYVDFGFDGAARPGLCAATAAGTPGFPVATCNPDFNFWQVGSRTQWNPVSQLDLGIDLLYSQLQTGNADGAATTTAPLVNDSSQGVFSVFLRAQRNFWP